MRNETIFAGVFGFAQLSMRDVGLVSDKGQPTKKTKWMTPTEQDGIAIYLWIIAKIDKMPQWEIKQEASKVDAMVKNLFNEHKIINNYLLSLFILREWLDEEGEGIDQGILYPKINRIVAAMDSEIKEGNFDPEIKKHTARVAKNIFRQWAGKAQLTDEIFSLNSNRFLRKAKDVEQSKENV